MIEAERKRVRLKPLLGALGVAASSWYHRPDEAPRKPGPAPRPLDEALRGQVIEFARLYPWWGYKRLAIVMRRAGIVVSKKFVYAVFKAEDLTQKRRATKAELYQSAKLFELLPTRPNALWQTDVTYIHIPGHGWWYAVTVIDYYSRYLLACHLTPSDSAPAVSAAIDLAVAQAEGLHGTLEKMPFRVTDNGSCFLARHFQKAGQVSSCPHPLSDSTAAGLAGALPPDAQTGRGVLAPQDAREKLGAFQKRYNAIRPHWALEPEEGGDVLTPEDVYVKGRAITLPCWQGWAKAARKKLDEAMEKDAELRQAA